MKRFEAFIGDKWVGWEMNDTTQIALKAGRVIVSFETDQGKFKTFVNLDNLPAYTLSA